MLKRRAKNPITGETEMVDNISYKEWRKKVENVPAFKGDIVKQSEQIYSNKEIADKTKIITDKYTFNKSKWSGKIEIDNIHPSAKMWNCDIRTSNITSPHEILHEQLHAHSISYYDGNIYKQYQNIEEASVELLAQKISKIEKIPIIASEYDEWTNNLRQINKIVKIENTEIDFAKRLFAIPLPDRLDFLEDKIYNYAKARTIMEAQELNALMEDLYVK